MIVIVGMNAQYQQLSSAFSWKSVNRSVRVDIHIFMYA